VGPITLRNLPEAVSRALLKRTQEKGISLNRAVIELLLKALDLEPRKRRRFYTDLDFLAGTWTEKEAREFDDELALQRKIDPEMWK
jgi:hypothetical protein